MATLNGVEFEIIQKNTTVIHDNVIKEIPGSDTVVQEDQGYSTAPMELTCHVKNEYEFDDFKEQYYSGGELTLIVDPDSGRQYTVYGSVNRLELEGERTYPLIDVVFGATFLMKTPYIESIATNTRTKTISSNNQEWTTDDSGDQLKTDGNVDAVPDILVTSGIGGTDLDINQSSYNTITTIDASNTVGQTFIPAGDKLKDIVVECDGYNGGPVTVTMRVYDSVAMTNELGSKTQVIVAFTNTFTFATPIDIGNKDLMYFRFDTVPNPKNVRLRISNANPYSGGAAYLNDVIQAANDFQFKTHTSRSTVKDAEIYNIADSTVKCAVTNDMLYEAIHRINIDGTGTVEYDEDFSTGKYKYDSINLNCSCDDVNNELDIADDGYIYWEIDTKYPIKEIPALTAKINTTTGTPTIQISSNGTTWYDIDTAIVDDVETSYQLDSDGNLSFPGKTKLYFRVDCVKAAAATCTIKYFKLNVNMHTIYAKNPKILKGATASTYRCDQDSDSGMNCEVELCYRDRKWA